MSKEQTPAQFIADLLCKREGEKENIPTPPNYWNMPEWKVKYKRRILEANKFLKVYPFEVITEVLLSKKYNWVYSLHFPGLKQPLDEENGRFERKQKLVEHREEKREQREEVESSGLAPTILQGDKSLRSRLD